MMLVESKKRMKLLVLYGDVGRGKSYFFKRICRMLDLVQLVELSDDIVCEIGSVRDNLLVGRDDMHEKELEILQKHRNLFDGNKHMLRTRYQKYKPAAVPAIIACTNYDMSMQNKEKDKYFYLKNRGAFLKYFGCYKDGNLVMPESYGISDEGT